MAKLLDRLALQLYTIQDILDRDFAEAARVAAEIGYLGVEFSPRQELTARQVRTVLDGYGLAASGLHIGLDVLTSRAVECAEYAAEVGSKRVLVPWSDLHSPKDADEIAAKINAVADRYFSRGVALDYHNHGHEFGLAPDGRYLFDLLMERLDPRIGCELDTHWVAYAGADLDHVMRKYAGRTPVMHLKDLDPNDRESFPDIGAGTLDFASIIELAQSQGTREFVVEQDKSPDPLATARHNFHALMELER